MTGTETCRTNPGGVGCQHLQDPQVHSTAALQILSLVSQATLQGTVKTV